MAHLLTPGERLLRAEESRLRMLKACDAVGLPDVATALDEYIQDLVRLNGDEFNALQDLLRSRER